MDAKKLTETQYFIRLDRGENVNQTLKKFCRENEIKCARIHGLGALEECELGYYDYHADIYKTKVLEDEFELLSMEGNVSMMDSEPFVHLHVSLSDNEFRSLGGHLFEAKVAVTVECWMEVFPYEFTRSKGEKEKFRPLSF
ncbi:PPC domain-containing DNA-binding protein [Bacteriovorax sp. DB6_IX]|uniref:PPC domain-containing DNA-binding protein n=1 Tax=Bacteriovorax sp. DB6_IX TaxID=1353530 RepID=UPI00038A2D0C|nr:PPC domain-containing DNA-binding protein [Bacteriovorax sp. DB6_IX]EQC51646.1 PF03479 domain protein [Bacteriovorax sp. DB6_IX]